MQNQIDVPPWSDEAIQEGRACTPQPLPKGLPPVLPLPLDALPISIRPWVEDVAELMQCQPDFVAVPSLVGASSLLARKMEVRPQLYGDWKVRPTLWAMIVGRPGAKKSPALMRAIEPLTRLELEADKAYRRDLETYELQQEVAKIAADTKKKSVRDAVTAERTDEAVELLRKSREQLVAPLQRRFLVNDVTYEKLGEILADNPEGVLYLRDELAGFLKQLSQEEHSQARSFLLQAWSGGRYTFDRISRGTLTIEDACLSVVGNIQPGPLSELLRMAMKSHGSDGLLERFLYCWPDDLPSWRHVDRTPNTAAASEAARAFDRLHQLQAGDLGTDLLPPVQRGLQPRTAIGLTTEAATAFAQWNECLEFSIREPGAESDFEAAMSKYTHHLPALALTLHCLEGEDGPVSMAAMSRAIKLMEYFDSHARRAYGSASQGIVASAKALLGRIHQGRLGSTFTAREVYRHQWAKLATPVMVSDAVELLAELKWLDESKPESEPSGGRPKTTYSLNPLAVPLLADALRP